MPVKMTCMTTKQQFEVSDEEATVVVLKNGRYAYRVKCPWQHPKTEKDLYAFKFCSAQAHENWIASHPEAAAPSTEEPTLSEASTEEPTLSEE